MNSLQTPPSTLRSHITTHRYHHIMKSYVLAANADTPTATDPSRILSSASEDG